MRVVTVMVVMALKQVNGKKKTNRQKSFESRKC